MNEVIKSGRASNRKYIVSQILFGLAIAALWPIYHIFYPSPPGKDSYYILVGSSLLLFILRESFVMRVTEIEFNAESREVIFKIENLISKRRQKNIYFNNTHLEIEKRFGWRGDNLVIHFFSSRVAGFRVSKSKDGFTNDMLVKIRDLAQKNGLRVLDY